MLPDALHAASFVWVRFFRDRAARFVHGLGWPYKLDANYLESNFHFEF